MLELRHFDARKCSEADYLMYEIVLDKRDKMSGSSPINKNTGNYQKVNRPAFAGRNSS